MDIAVALISHDSSISLTAIFRLGCDRDCPQAKAATEHLQRRA